MITRAQFNHRMRWAAQSISRPRIAIVGGYHHGNLGDMALGAATQSILSRLPETAGSRVGLQTIYSLQQWPSPEFIVVGGGAVLTDINIRKLIFHSQNRPERVAIVGTDFLRADLSPESIDFLRHVPFLAFRSDAGASKAINLGLNKAQRMPDIVFALPQPQKVRRRKVFGVNIVPRLRGDCTSKGNSIYARAYRDFMRSAVEHYRGRGFKVEHIPFTPQDDTAAKAILTNMDVEFKSYTDVPLRVLNWLNTCEAILPSRFHCLIFAMISGTPAIPFLYAPKSERLLFEYFSGVHGITAKSLAAGVPECDDFNPVEFDRITVKNMRLEVQRNFSRLSALLFLQTCS